MYNYLVVKVGTYIQGVYPLRDKESAETLAIKLVEADYDDYHVYYIYEVEGSRDICDITPYVSLRKKRIAGSDGYKGYTLRKHF